MTPTKRKLIEEYHDPDYPQQLQMQGTATTSIASTAANNTSNNNNKNTNINNSTFSMTNNANNNNINNNNSDIQLNPNNNNNCLQNDIKRKKLNNPLNQKLTTDERNDKIKSIIEKQIQLEIKHKHEELKCIEHRLHLCKELFRHTRFGIVYEYYTKQNLQYSTGELQQELSLTNAMGGFDTITSANATAAGNGGGAGGITGDNNTFSTLPNTNLDIKLQQQKHKQMHVSLKKLLGKKTVDYEEILKVLPQRQAAKTAKTTFNKYMKKKHFKEKQQQQQMLKLQDNKQQRQIRNNNSLVEKMPPKPTTTLEKQLPKLNSARGRNKERQLIIVGNTSKYIGHEACEIGITHKWIVYVITKTGKPIESIVSSVRFYLHSSYKPNHIIDVSSPPFQLTRRGWGEFPIRLKLYFHPFIEQSPAQVIHNLILDKKLTGMQTMGAETVFELWINSMDSNPQPVELKIEKNSESSIKPIYQRPNQNVINTNTDDNDSKPMNSVINTMDTFTNNTMKNSNINNNINNSINNNINNNIINNNIINNNNNAVISKRVQFIEKQNVTEKNNNNKEKYNLNQFENIKLNNNSTATIQVPKLDVRINNDKNINSIASSTNNNNSNNNDSNKNITIDESVSMIPQLSSSNKNDDNNKEMKNVKIIPEAKIVQQTNIGQSQLNSSPHKTLQLNTNPQSNSTEQLKKTSPLNTIQQLKITSPLNPIRQLNATSQLNAILQTNIGSPQLNSTPQLKITSPLNATPKLNTIQQLKIASPLNTSAQLNSMSQLNTIPQFKITSPLHPIRQLNETPQLNLTSQLHSTSQSNATPQLNTIQKLKITSPLKITTQQLNTIPQINIATKLNITRQPDTILQSNPTTSPSNVTIKLQPTSQSEIIANKMNSIVIPPSTSSTTSSLSGNNLLKALSNTNTKMINNQLPTSSSSTASSTTPTFNTPLANSINAKSDAIENVTNQMNERILQYVDKNGKIVTAKIFLNSETNQLAKPIILTNNTITITTTATTSTTVTTTTSTPSTLPLFNLNAITSTAMPTEPSHQSPIFIADSQQQQQPKKSLLFKINPLLQSNSINVASSSPSPTTVMNQSTKMIINQNTAIISSITTTGTTTTITNSMTNMKNTIMINKQNFKVLPTAAVNKNPIQTSQSPSIKFNSIGGALPYKTISTLSPKSVVTPTPTFKCLPRQISSWNVTSNTIQFPSSISSTPSWTASSSLKSPSTNKITQTNALTSSSPSSLSTASSSSQSSILRNQNPISINNCNVVIKNGQILLIDPNKVKVPTKQKSLLKPFNERKLAPQQQISLLKNNKLLRNKSISLLSKSSTILTKSAAAITSSTPSLTSTSPIKTIFKTSIPLTTTSSIPSSSISQSTMLTTSTISKPMMLSITSANTSTTTTTITTPSQQSTSSSAMNTILKLQQQQKYFMNFTANLPPSKIILNNQNRKLVQLQREQRRKEYHERLETKFHQQLYSLDNVQKAIEFLLKSIPLIHDGIKCIDKDYQRVYPFCVDSEESYRNLLTPKQRCYEWYRAKLINRMLAKHSTFNNCTDKLWTTKEIILFARKFGYSPPHKLNFNPMELISKQQQNVGCPLNSSKLTSTLLTNPNKLENIIKDEIKREKLQNQNTLIKMDNITNWLNVSNLIKCEPKENLPKIDGDSYQLQNNIINEVIDVECIDQADDVNLDKFSIYNNQNLLPLNKNLHIESNFIRSICKCLQIQLKPEEISSGVFHSSAELVLIKALQCFVEDLIRKSCGEKYEQMGATTTATNTITKYTSKHSVNQLKSFDNVIRTNDIRQVIIKTKRFDFLTNKYLGISNDDDDNDNNKNNVNDDKKK